MKMGFCFDKNVLFLSMCIASFVVAFSIPDDPLKLDLLRVLVERLGALIPAVEKAARISAISDIAAVYWVLMWLGVLLWLPFYFLLTDEQIRPFDLVEKKKIAFILAPILVMALLYLLFYFPIDGRGGRAQAMLSTRFGLALIGGLLFSGTPLLIRAMFMWVRYLPRLVHDSESNTRN